MINFYLDFLILFKHHHVPKSSTLPIMPCIGSIESFHLCHQKYHANAYLFIQPVMNEFKHCFSTGVCMGTIQCDPNWLFPSIMGTCTCAVDDTEGNHWITPGHKRKRSHVWPMCVTTAIELLFSLPISADFNIAKIFIIWLSQRVFYTDGKQQLIFWC